MAKKNKFDFSAFVEDLKSTSINEPVSVDVKIERKYFLIVCEGERTEPLYFKYFQKLLPKNLLNTIEISGEGDNTINIVKRCIDLKEERENNSVLPNYNHIWAVFDKDDFPNVNFDGAIDLAEKNDINAGYSNQSFELWYVLHFQYLTTCIHRRDYLSILTKHLGFKYEKNNKDIVDYFFKNCDIIQAIKWAKALDEYYEEGHIKPSDSCPRTKVYILVNQLLQYCQHAS